MLVACLIAWTSMHQQLRWPVQSEGHRLSSFGHVECLFGSMSRQYSVH